MHLWKITRLIYGYSRLALIYFQSINQSVSFYKTTKACSNLLLKATLTTELGNHLLKKSIAHQWQKRALVHLFFYKEKRALDFSFTLFLAIKKYFHSGAFSNINRIPMLKICNVKHVYDCNCNFLSLFVANV